MQDAPDAEALDAPLAEQHRDQEGKSWPGRCCALRAEGRLSSAVWGFGVEGLGSIPVCSTDGPGDALQEAACLGFRVHPVCSIYADRCQAMRCRRLPEAVTFQKKSSDRSTKGRDTSLPELNPASKAQGHAGLCLNSRSIICVAPCKGTAAHCCTPATIIHSRRLWRSRHVPGRRC